MLNAFGTGAWLVSLLCLERGISVSEHGMYIAPLDYNAYSITPGGVHLLRLM